MSKDRLPEVGDVWFEEPTEITFVILSVTDNGGYVYAKYFDGFRDVGFIEREEFKKLTYLGKSKANINDLFEVQDD